MQSIAFCFIYILFCHFIQANKTQFSKHIGFSQYRFNTTHCDGMQFSSLATYAINIEADYIMLDVSVKYHAVAFILSSHTVLHTVAD